MSEAGGSGSSNRVLKRPIENSYVLPDSNLVAGEYPGAPPTTAEAQLKARLGSFLDEGITVFIDLTAPKDALAPYEPTLRALAEQRGIDLQYEHFPIADMNVCDDQVMCSVLDAIDEHLAAKRRVYVHCWGGVGRTGTVVGCWLVRHGSMGKEALAEVARLFATMSKDKTRRHAGWGSPQTPKQREMVEEWPESVMFRLTSAKTKEARRRRKERAGPGGSVPTTVRPRAAEPEVTYSAEEEEEADDHAMDEMEDEEDESEFDEIRRHARIACLLHTRIRGCLLGGALGDALGWPVEFMSLGEIRKRFGAEGIADLVLNSKGVAEVTDDTQMTLFTAEGILRSTTRWTEHHAYREPEDTNWSEHHLSNSGVMTHAYLRWLATQEGRSKGEAGSATQMAFIAPGWLVDVARLHVRRSPGNTCVSALRNLKDQYAERAANNSKGCGGVMRVSPVGLIPCEDPFAYAAMAAGLTHGHPSGYLAAGAYAHILSTLLFSRLDKSGRPTLRDAAEFVLNRLSTEPRHEETLRALEGALELAARSGEPSAERVEGLGAGWVAEEALAIGVYCAIVGESFEHGVRLAVNHSGDSDSTGSIAGALLGVQCGEYGLPREWLAKLELRDVITAVGDDLLMGYGGGAGWRERYPGV